jgi:hypothetical protein
MANSVKRAAAALAIAAGAGALTGCGTVQGLSADISNILPNSTPTAAVQSRVGGVVATQATATAPGAYLDPRGYQRYSDTGAVVSAPQGSCNVLRQAAVQANRPYGTDAAAGRQVAGGLGNAAGGVAATGINGIVRGDPNTLRHAATVASGGIAVATRGVVTGAINSIVNGNSQSNAEARYQAAYQSCGQEFAAQVDARCAAPVGGNRNAAAYTTCFDRSIVNSPAPAKVPSR